VTAPIQLGRKVRAPPSRVLGNTQEGEPYGKCHRNTPPAAGLASAGKGEMVRQELTSNQETSWLDKPRPEQDRIRGPN